MFVKMLLLVLMILMVVSLIFYIISFKTNLEVETLSSYECGFDVMSMSRNLFSYRFFLISILFLIFDVEIALMLPTPYFSSLSLALTFLGFILILVVGLLYEYSYGMLDWL